MIYLYITVSHFATLPTHVAPSFCARLQAAVSLGPPEGAATHDRSRRPRDLSEAPLGNPVRANPPTPEGGAAGGRGQAERADLRGDDEARAEASAEQVARLASLEEAEDEAPDHAERKAVGKERQDFEMRRQHREQQQGDFGDGHQPEEQAEPSAAGRLGADLDSQVLRQRVSDNLADDEGSDDLLARLEAHARSDPQRALFARWRRLADSNRLLTMLEETLDHSDMLLAHPSPVDATCPYPVSPRESPSG